MKRIALMITIGLLTAILSGCRVCPPGIYENSREYYLPYEEGFASFVVQCNQGPFGHHKNGKNAIDFMMPINTHIVAARCGKVMEVVLSYPDNIQCPVTETCGQNYITIEHSDGTQAKYVHLKHDDNPMVLVGQYVERGQFIAFSGNTGYSWMPHLHFEVWGPDENGDLNKTLVVYFADVDGDGVPLAGTTYTSHNQPGTTTCYP
jgi:murein DD-endopeptidase MepM/ murein hydrolase activator NlpD